MQAPIGQAAERFRPIAPVMVVLASLSAAVFSVKAETKNSTAVTISVPQAPRYV